MRIKVLVPAYNCLKWLPRCLETIANQSVAADVLVIDDASTDPAQPEFIQRFATMARWDYQLNQTNIKCPANLWYGIGRLAPEAEDVIFLVDGDDFLPHDRVFERILNIYEADPDCWLTYGQYDCWPENTGQAPAQPFPPDVVAARAYRRWSTLFNHPITFKAFLWAGITEADLQDDAGHWFTGGYDQSIMYPLLEMAGQHYRVLDEVLYTYNAVNPLSEANAYPNKVDHTSATLRRRPPKPLLARPAPVKAEP